MQLDAAIRSAVQRAYASTPRGEFYHHRLSYAALQELRSAGVLPNALMVCRRDDLNDQLRALKDVTKAPGMRYVVCNPGVSVDA